MTRTGLDIIAAAGCRMIAGARVGLLANQASVSASFEHAREVIPRCGAELACLFGPQHGLDGSTQANMIEWEGYTDPRLGIPVYSLYGGSRTPPPEALDGLDAVVIDLPDVGARPYTFVWTALLMLRACAGAGVPAIVLDRPNPIGGEAIEGPLLENGYRSFVGLHPLALRHGMTIGEILALIRAEEDLPVSLEVIAMQRWRRSMLFAETGLPWVPPSPNMPTPETALLYPGMVLLEGTGISEGRGTTRPFEFAGAPWIEPERFAAALSAALSAAGIGGAFMRPAVFRPTFDKHAGLDCGGVQVHVTDPAVFRPVACAAALIMTAAELYPRHFYWTQPPYEYEDEKAPIDIIYGGPGLREAVAARVPPARLAASWTEGECAFELRRRPFLLYD